MFRWSKKKKHAADSEKDVTADQVTQLFTINLPNGQKNVVRVSPLMTLGDLVISVCKEKGLDLDLNRYVLQIPKNPGIPVAYSASIQQIGIQELNLVSLAYQDRNHAMSMPDLSKLPPSANQPQLFTSPSGHHKKKRGFLSFLGKKDKKYKSQFSGSLDTSINSNFSMSTPPAPRPTTPPSTHRRSSDQKLEVARPKSMFVSSSTPAVEDTLTAQDVQPVAPARKKRQAPQPPALADLKISEKQQNPSLEVNAQLNRDSTQSPAAVQTHHNINLQEDTTATVGSSQHLFQNEVPKNSHSCNSSDSSGYHELTLSRCESPETSHTNINETKTNIDVASLSSTDSVNKDSRIHSSPVQVLPENKVLDNSRISIESVVPAPISDSLTPDISDTLTLDKKITAPNLSIKTTPFPAASTITPTLSSTVTDSSKLVTQADFEEKIEPTVMPSHELSDFQDGKNQPMTFDINDILEGVVFEEEPWPMDLTLANRAGIEHLNQDSLMMVETASVTSEDIEQIDSLSSLQRPCSFIPPPPPSEPPPLEHQPVNLESLTYATPPIFVDKATEVNDDNVSLAMSSAKSSPGRASSGSMHEMALFMGITDNLAEVNTEEREDKLFQGTTSSPHIPRSNSSLDAGSVTWQKQVDYSISENPEDFYNQTSESSVVRDEITKSLTDVNSHQTSNDKGHILQNEENCGVDDDDDDDEEYYTEIIEELIIPLGPNGYDFSAARKKMDAESSVVQVKLSSKETKGRDRTDVFGTKSTSDIQLSSISTPTYQSQPKLTEPKTSPKKVVNVMSLESEKALSSVQNQSESQMSSQSPIRSKPDYTTVSTGTTDNRHYQNIQPEIVFNSHAQQVYATEEKAKTLPKLPTIESSMQANNVPASSGVDNINSNDLNSAKSRPHLLMNSHRSAVHQVGHAGYLRNDNEHQRSFNGGAGSYAGADEEQLDYLTSASNADTQEQQDAFQSQYYALQSQIQQWQEQLASQAVGSEFQAEHLQQMTEQIALQQQMMQQIQSTLLALQQQQHGGGQEHVELSADLPARMHQPVAGAAEPSYMVAASPPPSSFSTQKKQSKEVVKTESITARKNAKFERELSPRDQMMIAIRTFSRKNLKSVPIEKTRWTTSVL